MVAEIIAADEFGLWADYYLDLEDDSGAALVKVTQMLKCRREDTSKGVGKCIQQRLSNTRDVEMMAEALCHPSRGTKYPGQEQNHCHEPNDRHQQITAQSHRQNHIIMPPSRRLI